MVLDFLYILLRIIFGFIFTFIFPAKEYNKENVPKEGAVILACNHLSNIDPPLVGYYMKRRLIFMAKEPLWHVPILKNVMNCVKAIPVKRGENDRASIRAALNALKDEELLCIFPEGARSKDGNMQPASPGLGLLAAKSKATVIPVGVKGAHKLHFFSKLTVIYGEPMHFDAEKADKESIQKFTDDVMKEIAILIEKY